MYLSIIRYLPSLILAFVFFICCDANRVDHVLFMQKPEWSPKGRYIAVLKEEFDEKGKDCDCGEGSDPTIYLSPTGMRLCLYDTDGIFRKYLTPDSLNIGSQEWAPKGDIIAYNAYDRKGNIVMGLVDTNMNNVTWSIDDPYSTGFRWSPDGTELLYLNRTTSGTNTQLIARSVFSQSTRIVYEDTAGMIQSYDWSKGNRIALSITHSDIRYFAIINSDGRGFQIIDSATINSNHQIRWSPNDSLVMFVGKALSEDNQLFFLNIYSNEKTQRSYSSAWNWISGINFSWDGRYVSVSTSLGIYVIEVNGSNSYHITTKFSQCSWSPDSRKIVYVVDNMITIKAIE